MAATVRSWRSCSKERVKEAQAGAGLQTLDRELPPDVVGAGEAVDAAGGAGRQVAQGDDRVWSVL